jgi:hypothetical protein
MTPTLREYFAANAPAAPDWFAGPPVALPVRPERPASLTPEELNEVTAWDRDPCFDLDERNEKLSVYQSQVKAWARRRLEIEGQGRLSRLAAWSFAYADAMILASGSK